MASIMQILRRIGGIKTPPTSGSAGQLALWKAGTTPTDAASLYAHDGTQWVELLDTGKHAVTVSETAPASPTNGMLWFKASTKELSTWDGAQWSHVAFTNVANTFTKTQTIDVSVTTPALHVTQKGTGAALLVDDEASDTTPFVVDADGKVGVGVAVPNAKMQIDVGSNPTNPLVTITNGAAHGVQIAPGTTAAPSAHIGTYTNTPIGFVTNGAEHITILPNGAVGIANTNPQSTLDVIGTVLVAGDVDITSDQLYQPQFKSNAFNNNAESGGYLSFLRGRGTAAAKTAASPNDILGTISFAAWDGTGYKNGAAITSRYEQAFAGGVAPSNLAFHISRTSGTIEMLRFDSFTNIISNPMYVNAVSGSAVNVSSAGLVGRASSSLKYKKNVETLDPAIADNAVKNLRPVWYRVKEPKGDILPGWSHIGLIAEEVDKVEKRLVNYRTVEVSTGEDGERVVTPLETPVPEDVDYARLSVLLLDYVQRLEKRVAALEARP